VTFCYSIANQEHLQIKNTVFMYVVLINRNKFYIGNVLEYLTDQKSKKKIAEKLFQHLAFTQLCVYITLNLLHVVKILTVTDVLDYWQNRRFHLLQEEDEQQRVRVRRQHGCFDVVNFAELHAPTNISKYHILISNGLNYLGPVSEAAPQGFYPWIESSVNFNELARAGSIVVVKA
jgi:hypothetical protein